MDLTIFDFKTGHETGWWFQDVSRVLENNWLVVWNMWHIFHFVFYFFRILVLGILIPTDCHIFRGVVLPQTSISSCLLFLRWCFPSFLDQLMALQVKRHFSEITWLYKSWLNMFELSYIGNSSNKKGHIDEDIYNYIYIYDIICLQYIYIYM